MSDPPLIDRAVIDDLCNSIGDDGARSVIELFIGESRLYLATITAAATAAETDPLAQDRARRAAHSLKSGAGQIGAAAVAQAAAAVEHAAAGAGLAQAAAALQDCAVNTEAALERFLSGQ